MDKEHTQSLISRLGILNTTLKTVTIAFMVLFLGCMLALVVGFFFRDYWWLGGILGILLGYGFGIYFASVLNIMVEWMIQMLHIKE